MFPELSTTTWTVILVIAATAALMLFIRTRVADELFVGLDGLLPLLEELAVAKEGAWMSVVFMPGGQLDFYRGKYRLAMTFAVNEPDQQAHKAAAIEAYKRLGLDVREKEKNGFKFLDCELAVAPRDVADKALSIITKLRGDMSEQLYVIPDGFDYKRAMERVGT